MKKLRLAIDDLSVESFSTAEKEQAAGTVRGFDSTTAGQRLCGCTDEGGPCDTQDCGSYGCSGGCNDTFFVTCATGGQRICECG